MAVTYVRGETWFGGWMEPAHPPTGSFRNVTLNLPIHIPEFAPRIEIVSPASGVMLRQPFMMTGWAVDSVAPIGCGVDVVQVYAHFADGRSAFMGNTEYGEASPALVSSLGSRFRNCGWTFIVRGLPAGTHLLTAHPRDTVRAEFTEPAAVGLTVR
jgi:hypothetical protein